MDLLEAVATPGTSVDTLRRLNAAAPPEATYLTIEMPPVKSKSDADLIACMGKLGWRFKFRHENTVCMERTPRDLPTALL